MDPEVLDCLPKICSVLRIKLFFFVFFLKYRKRQKIHTTLNVSFANDKRA